MGADTELVEVVDDDGQVLAVVTREAMRAGNLRHRSVLIVVTHDAAVLAHRRSVWKDLRGGWWDLAFGGVPGVGEAWEAAAARELAEESGVRLAQSELHPLGSATYEDGSTCLVIRAFQVYHPGPFTCPDGEVDRVEWVQLADLDSWLTFRNVMPDTLTVIVPHLRNLLS